MKKTFLSFKSVADVIKYINREKPTHFTFDPHGLKLTMVDSPDKERDKKHVSEAGGKNVYMESLADLRIDLN